MSATDIDPTKMCLHYLLLRRSDYFPRDSRRCLFCRCHVWHQEAPIASQHQIWVLPVATVTVRFMLWYAVYCVSGRTTRTPLHLKKVTVALYMRSKITNLNRFHAVQRTNPVSAAVVNFALRSSDDICCNDQTYVDIKCYLHLKYEGVTL